MHNPKRDIKDLERFEQILTTLARHEFGFLLHKLNLLSHIPYHTRIFTSKNDKPQPVRLRETLEELGAVYIKLGQILAQRPDIVPEDYRVELEKLEDQVKPFDWEKAEKIIEEDLDTEQFRDIHHEPLAAASIAQVHRATLQNGDEVIIKIRRPNITEQVETDLEILHLMTREMEKHFSSLRKMRILSFVEEFSQWTREELDLEKEGRNAQIFKENMKDETHIKVPKIYPELTTERVLVMEYVDGVKCTDQERLRELDIDEEQIAKTAIKAGLKQSMDHGFFHADPHPSNFMITEKGEIAYIDFGMMGKISRKTSEKLGLMLLYLLREDVSGMEDCIKEIGTVTEDYNSERIEDIIERKVLALRNTTLREESITKNLFEMFVEVSRNGVIMPSKLTLMGKSLVTMEGIGMTIYPEFKITDEYQKIVEKELVKQNSPEKMSEDLVIDMIKNKELFTKLPSKINEKLENKPANVTVNQTHEDKNGSSLLTITLIVSATALLLASSLDARLFWIGLTELLLGTYLYKHG